MSNTCVSYIEAKFGELGYPVVTVTYDVSYDFGSRPVISFQKVELLVEGVFVNVLPLLMVSALVQYEIIIKEELEELRYGPKEE